MLDKGQTGRLICAIGAGLFGLALVAGVVQSLRVNQRLPAIDLFGNGSRAYINHLVAQKDYAGAIEQLQMQSRLLPLDADIYEQLGILLASQGLPEKAREPLQKLVQLRPDYAEGFNRLGSTYLDTNEPALAARFFAEAIRLDPQSSFAFNSLGVATAQLGNLAQAEKCFAKAVDLAPKFDEARINLDRARSELRRAP